MRATLSLLGCLAVCSTGCHRVPGPNGFCPGPIYGEDVPQVGPRSRLEIVRATRSDSLLASAAVGELVARLRWSSDSLASLSRPEGAVLDLTRRRTHASSGLFYRDALVTESFLVRVLRVPAGEYRLKVRHIATARFDTTVTVRRGFSDTANVYFQSGGSRVCY